ncbi:Protein of unknown function [Gryllus bimaculatus]|nr:Protein of unknown function [Gryllus bimaculatus]
MVRTWLDHFRLLIHSCCGLYHLIFDVCYNLNNLFNILKYHLHYGFPRISQIRRRPTCKVSLYSNCPLPQRSTAPVWFPDV